MNRYGAVLEEMGLALAVADFQRQGCKGQT